MDTSLKSQLTALAVRILEKLNYLPEAIRQFQETGTPFYSEEPHGEPYDLTDDMKKAIESFSNTALCYAVIHGTYITSGCGKLTMTTYLVLTESDLRAVQENGNSLDAILEPYTGKRAYLGYGVWAEVSSNATFGDLEFGSVCVRGLRGGLTRTY